MAIPAIIPKLGNTVESCIIVEWKKAVGETIAEGETLLDVETDKAVMEVPSPASGVVLAHLFAPGDLVPVLETIAVIGEAGENISAFGPVGVDGVDKETSRQVDKEEAVPSELATQVAQPGGAPSIQAPISPRARSLAQRAGLD
ncbi:MAG: biotin/lipoyl-containing protein, partial [Anaerolineae bacterium]